MVQEKELSCWAEFKDAVADVRKEWGYHEVSTEDGVHRVDNTVLFRGQSDASWLIETTLERRASFPMDVRRYIELASRFAPEIETYAGRSLVPSHADLERELRDFETCEGPFPFYPPAYEYLVYLRQHGFPSPLLDWTESPYIAAFFAFCERPRYDTKSAAVYPYISSVNSTRVGGSGPTIYVLGPNIRTHPRHFAQKAWYTVAAEWQSAAWRFCSHHQIVKQSSSPTQDILIKILLPVAARKDALRELWDYNINPFTLFQTEDALIKSIELRQFELDDI